MSGSRNSSFERARQLLTEASTLLASVMPNHSQASTATLTTPSTMESFPTSSSRVLPLPAPGK